MNPTTATPTTLGGLFQWAIGFIDTILVPLIFAIAFIVFLWGAYTYFIAGGANEEKRAEGQKFVLYAVIGFFLMFSIWGIVHLLLGTLGFNNTTRPDYPTFNKSGTTQTTTQNPNFPAATTNTNTTNTTNTNTTNATDTHGCPTGTTYVENYGIEWGSPAPACVNNTTGQPIP